MAAAAADPQQDEDLESNITLQKEELEALSAIYGEDFLLQQDYEDGDYGLHPNDNSESNQFPMMPTFSISIRPENNDENEILKRGFGDSEARLIISFQPGYPTSSPPIYQLSIPWIRGGQKQVIASALEELYLEHMGESIVYIWVEKLRELLRDELNSRRITDGDNNSGDRKSNAVASSPTSFTGTDPISSVSQEGELIDHFSNSLTFHPEAVILEEGGERPSSSQLSKQNTSGHVEIHTGAPLTDRKSTFQAHVAPVSRISDVRLVLDTLYQNKKIASATHNMYAYRIKSGDSTWLQDCDDDGETHAGSRLLHLLQILGVSNVMVVVSRWYGGIQLHADRFKHINNVARTSLVEFGFVSSPDGRKGGEDAKIKKGSGKR